MSLDFQNMNCKFIFNLITLLAILVHDGNCDGGDDQNALTITIGFESEIICSDEFFGQQLTKEVVQKFEKCNNIKWVLEPCEYSSICKETKKLSCPLGEDQCTLNKMQACAGKLFSSDANGIHYALFVACMLNTREPLTSGPTCASLAQIDWNKINECVCSGKGDEYCNEYHYRIQGRKPKWMPAIWFDWKYNEKEEAQAKENLTKTLCSKLKGKNLSCEVCNNTCD